MGAYDSRHTGRITITPPLTWAQIKNNTARGLQDLRLLTAEAVEETPSGRVTVITADTVAPITFSAYGGYDVQAELQSMIDAFPDHEFAGTITARPEDPDGDPWRYIIRDRKVIKQIPQTIWVDEEQQP